MADREIRDILKKAEGYEYALLTSFNYDFTFFERDLLPILWSRRIQKISLFVDADQLAESVQAVHHGSCALGRNYMISPIRVPGAFHPKVILLLGRQRAKVIIASANLTISGYFHNGEVFSEIDFDNQHPEGLGAILDTVLFFEQLFSRSHQLDQQLFEEIKSLLYYGKTYVASDRHVLTNMERPLLEQIRELCPEAQRIDIAVPYYDNQLAALTEIHSAYPDAELHIYLQNRKCRISKQALNTIPDIKLHIYQEFVANEKARPRFFHGKAMCFSGVKESLIVFGSANCTASALLKTPNDGGNVECVIADKGQAGEFTSFYERFCQVPDALESEPLVYHAQEPKHFVFRYGVLPESSQTIELYFDYQNPGESIEVSLSDQILSYEEKEKCLVVFLPIDNLESSENVIELTFRSGDSVEKISCWFINLTALKNHRIVEDSSAIRDIDYSSTGDRFAEDMQLLLEGIVLSADEEKLRQARRFAVEGIAQPSDEEDDSTDGVVSYVLPSIEDEEKYRVDKIAARILNERSIHLSTLIHRLPGEQEIKNIKECKESTIGIRPTNRAATSAERRFAGFYKRRVNNLLSKEFLEISNPGRFIDSSIIFLEILDKYSLAVSVEEVFQASFITETRANIISAVLGKCAQSNDKEQNEKIILLAVDAVLKNRLIELLRTSAQAKVSALNKDIMMTLEKHFQLREATAGYSLNDAVLKSVWNAMESKALTLSYSYGMRYMEELYGCKRWGELCDMFQKDYGSDVIVEKETEGITVLARMSKLIYRIPDASFFELRRYANRNGIRRAVIIIQNTGELKGPDPAIQVKFEIDFRNGKETQTVYGKLTQRNPTTRSIWS